MSALGRHIVDATGLEHRSLPSGRSRPWHFLELDLPPAPTFPSSLLRSLKATLLRQLTQERDATAAG